MPSVGDNEWSQRCRVVTLDLELRPHFRELRLEQYRCVVIKRLDSLVDAGRMLWH